jgi:hypothetical protein
MQPRNFAALAVVAAGIVLAAALAGCAIRAETSSADKNLSTKDATAENNVTEFSAVRPRDPSELPPPGR